MKNSAEDDIDNEDSGTVTFENTNSRTPKIELQLNDCESVIEPSVFDETSKITDEHFLTNSYDKVVNIFGRFQQESIALGLSELR